VVCVCVLKGLDGKTAAKAMILIDEIRGRLAEVHTNTFCVYEREYS